MTDAKVAYHHGDLRNALVETATELVRAAGAEHFSLRDAAKRLGVTANATYRHFDSKSALLSAVAVAAAEKLAAKMRRKVAEAERAHAGRGEAALAVECFKATARAYFAFAVEQPELFRVMHGPSGMCLLKHERIADRANAPQAYVLLGDALDRLVRVGILAPEDRAGGEVRAWTVVHGFASLVIDGAGLYPTIALRTAGLEDLLDFALRGLGVRPGPAA